MSPTVLDVILRAREEFALWFGARWRSCGICNSNRKAAFPFALAAHTFGGDRIRSFVCGDALPRPRLGVVRGPREASACVSEYAAASALRRDFCLSLAKSARSMATRTRRV